MKHHYFSAVICNCKIQTNDVIVLITADTAARSETRLCVTLACSDKPHICSKFGGLVVHWTGSPLIVTCCTDDAGLLSNTKYWPTVILHFTPSSSLVSPRNPWDRNDHGERRYIWCYELHVLWATGWYEGKCSYWSMLQAGHKERHTPGWCSHRSSWLPNDLHE